jgi:competence protein ComEA
MFKKLLATMTLFYAAASFAAVDVNTASAADLDNVKGIGPSMSARIIDERKKGNFKDWQDFIARVKGVGDKSAVRFSAEGLTVNGAAYPTGTAPAAKPQKPTSAKAPANPTAKP